MPFSEDFNDVYEFGIKGACSDVDVYCERVDEQIFLGSMLDRIYNQISRADLLVADMTGRNANVFYEVGYAHALGKSVVLLTQKTEDIPFDLKHFPHIVYGNKIKDLRQELAKRVKHLAYSSQKEVHSQIGLDVFLGQKPLSGGGIERKYKANQVPNATLTIFNGSSLTYTPGEFRVGIIAPPPFQLARDENVCVTALPDGNYLHMIPEFETLFPGAYTALHFSLDKYANYEGPSHFLVTIRVFSSAGFRDFPLSLRPEDA
jgi:hypothetical protein